jgi:acyl-CoA thioester hydrolase
VTTAQQGPNPLGVHRTRIEWIDTDAAGIYHNSTVVRFVEAAEASLMDERGLHGYFPAAPRVHYEVDFESPLFFGQDVCTVVELVRVGTASMTFLFEVWGEEFRGGPRRRAARGSYVTVHIDRDHRSGASSAAWPKEWTAALGSPCGGPTPPVRHTG